MTYLRGLTDCLIALGIFIEVSGTTWFPNRPEEDAEVHFWVLSWLLSCSQPTTSAEENETRGGERSQILDQVVDLTGFVEMVTE